MKWRLGTVLLGVALVLGACADDGNRGGDAGTDARLVSDASLGPVSATLTMDPAEPRFGDRVRFSLRATAASGAVLERPEIGARLGHFRVRDRHDESRVERGELDLTLVAEPEKTGTNIGRVPPIRFRVTEGEGAGEERELVLPPFEVDVAGLTPDQEPDLADLGTPLPPVALPATRGSGLAVWIGGVALLGVAALVWYWRRRRLAGGVLAVPEVDPETEAARAFDALMAAKLAEAGRFAEFYVRLTGIVRRYVERTTGVHAPEQTTEEFLREMERNPAFEGDRRRELGEFLAAADLVKYAAQVPTGEEIREAVAAARRFCGLDATAPEVAA